MEAEIINPFVTAAAEVLRAEAGLTVKRGALSLQSGAVTTDEVAVLLTLLGDIEGMVVFNFPLSLCLGLVSRMLDQEFEEFGELAQSGIAELGNVIAGGAATRMSNAGISADISVPTMIMGQGLSVAAPRFQRLVVPLETEYGCLEMHLAVRRRAG